MTFWIGDGAVRKSSVNGNQKNFENKWFMAEII